MLRKMYSPFYSCYFSNDCEWGKGIFGPGCVTCIDCIRLHDERGSCSTPCCHYAVPGGLIATSSTNANLTKPTLTVKLYENVL